MTYEEFVEKITPLCSSSLGMYSEINKYNTLYPELKKKEIPNALYFSDYVGGISGGSCWDDGTHGDPHYATTNSENVEQIHQNMDETIVDILTEICPNLGFLQYKKLMIGLVETVEKTFGEYYGNSTNYLFLVVQLKEFYNKLVECNLI